MIDALIAAAAKDGRLSGLTLYSTLDGRWQASLSPDRVSWSVSIDSDPVTALCKALDVRPATPQEDIFG